MLLVKCSQRGSLVPRKLSSPLLSLSPDPFLHVRLTVQITRATPPPSHEHRAERSPCPAARRGKATRKERKRERSKERKIRTCGIICYVAKWGWTPVGRPRFYLNSLNSRLSFASRSNTRSLHRPEPFIALVNSERKKKNLLLLTPIVKSPIVNLANSLANRILGEAMEKARERERVAQAQIQWMGISVSVDIWSAVAKKRYRNGDRSWECRRAIYQGLNCPVVAGMSCVLLHPAPCGWLPGSVIRRCAYGTASFANQGWLALVNSRPGNALTRIRTSGSS